ncbi:ATPase associated with various cellular activities AAA_5 [Oscillochloris trichoides DG-6]|uniref:ATPase associated with various cellular activities AAA_5 n=1 Tax=Oscillochloris trichoides DG-6 TaxID=765420 RepID=E1IEY1_9CHLR|nr:AAA family ATPase [Oscillochloris trichoides]EFO80278.1 ATPase associated with various cellular activities AAA_5 [Oscillochloris trichoides DG-6]
MSLSDLISLLRFNVSDRLKQDFVGKDQVIDLMLISAIAREHLLLVGPPGTAKSELVKRFVLLLGARKEAGDLFEYLLTRFTEPNEIFGPVNIREFQQGTFTRTIERALPQAKIAFLDEVFKANSAILNALLTILNERFFYNGLEQVAVPLISLYGATNEVPEGDELGAIFDRFLLRVRTDHVDERYFPDLLAKGWSLERERIRLGRSEALVPVLDSLDHLQIAYDALEQIALAPIFDDYREVVRQIRAEGITLSDRRAVKLLKLIAAAALLRGSNTASPADFWVLLHVWNRPEQISALQAIVGPLIERAGGQALTAERDLATLSQEVARLALRVHDQSEGRTYTPTYFGTLLHDLERLRQEILGHSAGRMSATQPQWQALVTEVERLIDAALDRLEA